MGRWSDDKSLLYKDKIPHHEGLLIVGKIKKESRVYVLLQLSELLTDYQIQYLNAK